jgi:hypothetical protein
MMPSVEEIGHMNRKNFIVGVLAAGCFIVTAAILPSVGDAQMDNVKTSMAALKAKTAKLGAPKIEGNDPVAGKDVPGLYFGTTKMNNFFDVVDEVVKENGGTATLFVKAGEEYVRVATNVKKDDGSRAIGTILDPCLCRKLNPNILMVQSAKNWCRQNASDDLNGPRDRCIFH